MSFRTDHQEARENKHQQWFSAKINACSLVYVGEVFVCYHEVTEPIWAEERGGGWSKDRRNRRRFKNLSLISSSVLSEK